MEGITYESIKREWLAATPSLSARTSGSTGKPKEISLPREVVIHSAERTVSFFRLGPGSRVHSCISPEFIGGKMMLIRALVCGAEFTYEKPSNRPVIPCGTVDLVSVVPSQMRYILDRKEDYSHVKRFLIGGSAIPASMRREIAASGLECYESYGMTETASHIALRRVTAEELPFEAFDGIRLSADSRGCLVIGLEPDMTVVTNDIVRFEDDTRRRFTILGRVDHVIVTGGKKVHPAEVEKIISPLFPDCDICVTRRPDDLWGQRVVLLVEAPSIDNEEKIFAELRKMLPPYCVPKEIIAVPSLPRTSSGKILRAPLPAEKS